MNLEWNSLGAADSSLAALFEGIAINHSLVYLNLSNNQISHIGAQFIASALITNETLVELGEVYQNGNEDIFLLFKLHIQCNITMLQGDLYTH